MDYPAVAVVVGLAAGVTLVVLFGVFSTTAMPRGVTDGKMPDELVSITENVSVSKTTAGKNSHASGLA